MIIEINDDLDLNKIALSGQCFRCKTVDENDEIYRFITDEHLMYMKQVGQNEFDVTCSRGEWDEVWHDYFDLERSYSKIAKDQSGIDVFVDSAIDHGRGLRILKQDKWEMLVSFIISQQKSIPLISAAVEKLSMLYGKKLDSEYEEVYAFPKPEALGKVSEDELRDCSLGYRAPYVMDAAARVSTGAMDLEAAASLSDDELFEKLMEVKGVGKKVSNCICLFAYGRVGRAPVDVWIQRAIDEKWGGKNRFPEFGDTAGIIQQYIFYYMRA